MSNPQPGSQDDHKVEVIAVSPESEDIALAVLVHTNGRVQFNGRYHTDSDWVIETLTRLIAAIRAEVTR